jgi:hypothetical protein
MPLRAHRSIMSRRSFLARASHSTSQNAQSPTLAEVIQRLSSALPIEPSYHHHAKASEVNEDNESRAQPDAPRVPLPGTLTRFRPAWRCQCWKR